MGYKGNELAKHVKNERVAADSRS